MPIAKEKEEKEKLTLQNFYTGMCVKWKVFEVMCPLCILHSDIMQRDTSARPILYEGSETSLYDKSLPPIY
jgi:hypothetical protein